MKPPSGPKKTNPKKANFTYPKRHALSYAKGVKQKSDAGCQRSDICLPPSVFCKRFDFGD